MKGLYWFRRDLRYFGNEALIYAIKAGTRNAVFFVSKSQWAEHDAAAIQVDLILRRVAFLGKALARYGVTLHIIEAPDFNLQQEALISFCEEHDVSEVYANAEYEINERERDVNIANSLSALNMAFYLYDGDVIAKPGTVTTNSGEMFKVFTPFKKAWLKQREHYFPSIEPWPLAEQQIDWAVPNCLASSGESSKWPVDDETLYELVDRFITEKLMDYSAKRDFPSIKGTSGLSPYFALGIVSVKQVLAAILQAYPDLLNQPSRPEFSWINELIWREFYRHLIFTWPHLCKRRNFNNKYDFVVWRSNQHEFTAWCEGKTGYPLVDAAMRQLNQTGWMHNRLRMVVASFLTKHLLIDWRLGEKYFMSKLIDGDLASNNGGWQWAASTGCDAQPYFRIFNPITQSEKFDPKGTFIRKYVTELKEVPDKYIHFPHDYLVLKPSDYPKPIVDHKLARERALAAFKGE
ncbi:Deoxyribodipyrimidine photolyase [Pseudoalteromonas luteoviolacea B = ATCC 29581]|nr:Deoxyribodipyrimidine photolyase [Pseudoalteromonas luteoviolacea B = ATCC 29581]